jgi:hypothetical protein
MVVIGDIGGTKAVLAVIAKLKEFGHEVQIVADPKGLGKSTLDDQHLPYEEFGHAGLTKPDLLLVGTSATALNAQVEITGWCKNQKVPIVWLEDFWGTAIVALCQHKMARPNYLFTLDAAGSRHMGIEYIVTGNPALDRLATWNVAEARKRVRQAMGIPDDTHIVSYFGPGYEAKYPARVFESLALLVPDLVQTGATFLPVLHPKDETLTPGFDEMFKTWTSKPNEAPFPVRLDGREHIQDITELVCVSDVVTSPNSTELLSACLLGVPAISVLGRQSRQYLADRGMNRLPCVENASAGEISPESPFGLKILLESPDGRTEMTRTQRAWYKNDGGACDRVVAEIQKILDQ